MWFRGECVVCSASFFFKIFFAIIYKWKSYRPYIWFYVNNVYMIWKVTKLWPLCMEKTLEHLRRISLRRSKTISIKLYHFDFLLFWLQLFSSFPIFKYQNHLFVVELFNFNRKWGPSICSSIRNFIKGFGTIRWFAGSFAFIGEKHKQQHDSIAVLVFQLILCPSHNRDIYGHTLHTNINAVHLPHTTYN